MKIAPRAASGCAGTAQQLEQTFGSRQLQDYEHTAPPPAGRYFHAFTGKVVRAGTRIRGHRNRARPRYRPIAQPAHPLAQASRSRPIQSAAKVSLPRRRWPPAYDYPTAVNGAGQCIALIELGGGYEDSDIETYFGQLGITPPTVVAVPVDGGTQLTRRSQWCRWRSRPRHPGRRIDRARCAHRRLLRAQHQSGLSGRHLCRHPRHHQQALGHLDLLGRTGVFMGLRRHSRASTTPSSRLLRSASPSRSPPATPDRSDGVSDGANHVDFPSSSPHVLACGGTAA